SPTSPYPWSPPPIARPDALRGRPVPISWVLALILHHILCCQAECARFRISRNPRRHPMSEPSSLAEALRAALARLPTTGLVHYPIWADWPAIVGSTIAAHARPAQLRRGILVVSVDGPEWMHEL